MNILMKKKNGFTFVEMLVVLAIVSVLFTVLYGAFQTGLMAYTKTEQKLSDSREGDVFIMQIQQELRNAVPYYQRNTKIYFSGTDKSISFPTFLQHYSKAGREDDFFMVSYEVKGRTLVRKEKKMKSSFKDKKTDSDEVVFKKLKTCKFEYMFVNKNHEILWENEWKNEPYMGLPRGVRLTLAGDVFGKTEKNVDILIPQGILFQKNG